MRESARHAADEHEIGCLPGRVFACRTRASRAELDPAPHACLVVGVLGAELALEVGLLVADRDPRDHKTSDRDQQEDPAVGECDAEARLH